MIKKLVGIIPYPVFPANMGGQRAIVLLYNALVKQVNISAISIQSNQSNSEFEVAAILSNHPLRYISVISLYRILQYAKQQQASHLIFEHPYFAWIIWIIKKFTSYKVIIHSHNIESLRFKSVGKFWWKGLWYYERWAHRCADTSWFITAQDLQYAIQAYQLDSTKCFFIPYGTTQTHLPEPIEIQKAKQYICTTHHIDQTTPVYLFNGALQYKPNYDAVQVIATHIIPALRAKKHQFHVLICGKGLPEHIQKLFEPISEYITYTGFVADIDIYFKGCDMFLNPVIEGGGVKTKLVEALGFGKVVISSQNGAFGVDPSHCEGRLQIVPDADWVAFADKILYTKQPNNNNQEFYMHHTWQRIASKALATL